MTAEEKVFQAGYKKAITDVCELFDLEHEKLVKCWKDKSSTEDAMRRVENNMTTLNLVIYELNTRLLKGRVVLE